MSTGIVYAMMSDEQIEELVDKFRKELLEHRGEITYNTAQKVIEVEGIGLKMFLPLRERAEALSNLIVRKVKVDRSRSPQDAINATGRAGLINSQVVNAMPTAEADEVEVVFFKVDMVGRNGYISDDDLEKEFELRGLKPADPFSVAAVNEADPAFADEKPNGTHWKDNEGDWCYATFCRWRDKRLVNVGRRDDHWDGGWYFAAIRK